MSLPYFGFNGGSEFRTFVFIFTPIPSHHSLTRPPNQSTIITSTMALWLQLWKSLIHELIGFLLYVFLCVFTQSPFYNKQRNPIKVRQVKVHLQQQQLWCGVPLPLHAFEHFELLPAIVSLHPGLSRWSPILGDEGHPRKTVRKLGTPHTVQWTNCNIFQHNFLSCPFTSSLDSSRN